MKIAIVGLASERPCQYGEILMAKDIEIACIWDYAYSKADEYHRRFRGAVIVDFDQIPDIGVDGSVLTLKRGDYPRYALPLIAGGVPILISEPSAVSDEDMDRMLEASQEHGTPVMLTSDDDPAVTMEAFLRMCDEG